jgi:hypothetical protein
MPTRAGGVSRQRRSDTADRAGTTTCGLWPPQHRCRVPRSCLSLWRLRWSRQPAEKGQCMHCMQSSLAASMPVRKNYSAHSLPRCRLTFLSNVVAYACRHSHAEERQDVHSCRQFDRRQRLVPPANRQGQRRQPAPWPARPVRRAAKTGCGNCGKCGNSQTGRARRPIRGIRPSRSRAPPRRPACATSPRHPARRAAAPWRWARSS